MDGHELRKKFENYLKCDHCSYQRPAYNSCRNRHCPKCQTITKEKWLNERRAELLPCGYFHLVFTLPHKLNALIMGNKSMLLGLLFKTAAQVLQLFGKDRKWRLGGKLGFISVLHTWSQTLIDHFHLHCLVPAGALTFDESGWIKARKKYLFANKALAKAFKHSYIKVLVGLYESGKLKFAGNRIVSIKDGTVTFTYRDRADENKQKLMTLAATEFIRRFLLHVLPDGFVKIRYFGFLAHRNKTRCIALIRKLIDPEAEPIQKLDETPAQMMLRVAGIDITCCPRCGKGKMVTAMALAKIAATV